MQRTLQHATPHKINCIHTHAHTNLHAHMHLHIHVHIHLHFHLHIPIPIHVHIHIHAYTDTCTHTFNLFLRYSTVFILYQNVVNQHGSRSHDITQYNTKKYSTVHQPFLPYNTAKTVLYFFGIIWVSYTQTLCTGISQYITLVYYVDLYFVMYSLVLVIGFVVYYVACTYHCV